MRIPGAISPRLRVGLRKTGYLGLCTGSGHFIRDIFRPGRTRFHLQICRTSAGQCPATDFLRYAKDVIYLRIPDYNFRWKRSTTPQDHMIEKLTRGFPTEKFSFRAAGQGLNVSCKLGNLSCKPSMGPYTARNFTLDPHLYCARSRDITGPTRNRPGLSGGQELSGTGFYAGHCPASIEISVLHP